MPDVIDPPQTKPSFQQIMAANRPKDEKELKEMESGAAPKPDPAPPKQPERKTAMDGPALGSAAAPATDPDAEILEGRRTPKNDDFKRVKHAATEASKERDALRAKFEAAEKRAAELEKKSGNREELERIKKERDELAGKWQAVAAQFDSGFHTKYEARVGEAIAKIKDAVPADRLDKISQLLQMPESEWKRKAMAELTEDMDPPTITDIMLANREVRDILSARKKELEDSGTILKTSAEQRRKEQDERKAAYVKSFDSMLAKKSTGDDAFPTMITQEGDTAEIKAWNSGVAERAAVARAIFLDEFETPEEKAEAAILSANAPGFLAELKAARAENAQLKETLAKLQSASPGIGTGGKIADGGQKMTFQERMAQAAI